MTLIKNRLSKHITYVMSVRRPGVMKLRPYKSAGLSHSLDYLASAAKLYFLSKWQVKENFVLIAPGQTASVFAVLRLSVHQSVFVRAPKQTATTRVPLSIVCGCHLFLITLIRNIYAFRRCRKRRFHFVS